MLHEGFLYCAPQGGKKKDIPGERPGWIAVSAPTDFPARCLRMTARIWFSFQMIRRKVMATMTVGKRMEMREGSRGNVGT